MKFLITGISGFAGPHLANILIRDGHNVHGLVRGSNGMETDILDVVEISAFNKIKFVYGNLKNERQIYKIIREGEYDGVFHLAAQSHPPTSFSDPIGTFEDNIIGSSNLINAISDISPGTKLMFCSTSEVYGNVGADGRKITEKDHILPANPYGVSKASIDLYMQERMANGKIKGFITRAFSHTGPRRGKNFSISSDAYQIANMKFDDKVSRVLKVGNLNTTRVVMDVRDCVNAYYLLMLSNKSTGEIYNVCGGVPHKMQFFTDTLIKLSGVHNITQSVYKDFWRPNDIHYQHGSTEKLIDHTGWREEYMLDQTMLDLLDYWYNKFLINYEK